MKAAKLKLVGGAPRVAASSVLAGGQAAVAYPMAAPHRMGGPAGPRTGSADRHLSSGVRRNLRAYSQHLDRTSPIYRMAVDRWVQAVVGGPWQLQATSSSPAFNEAAEAMFARWWADGVDHRGLVGGEELMQTAERCATVDGDYCLVLTDALTLQGLEAEQLGGPNDRARGSGAGGRAEGLSFAAGRLAAFRFADYDDSGNLKPVQREVPAALVLYLPHLRRGTQSRGEPPMTPAFALLEHLEDFVTATTQAAKTAAAVALVRTMESPAMAMAMPGEDVPRGDGETDRHEDFELGTIYNQRPGEALTQVKAEHPTTTFSDFVRQSVGMVGALVGMPLEWLLLDYRQTNFHSAKSSQGQLDYIVAPRRAVHAALRARVYRWAVGAWIDRGMLPAAPADWDSHRWTPPPRPKMDPLKEAMADQLRVAQNFTTLRRVVESYGGDLDEVLQQRAAEVARQDELGITPADAAQSNQLNGAKSVGALGTGNVDETGDGAG